MITRFASMTNVRNIRRAVFAMLLFLLGGLFLSGSVPNNPAPVEPVIAN